MSRKYTLLALFVSVALWLANSGNPPNGKTGAPGEGTCSDCHTLNGGTQDGSIAVTGIPAVIEPNTAYVLTVTNSNPNGVAELAGFQVTILNGNNQRAGNMSGASANSHLEGIAPAKQYWEHFPAVAYPGSNMAVWTVTWMSPAGPANTTITYYAAGNVANGTGTDNGDLIVLNSASGMLNGGGTPLAVTITNSNNVLCFGGNSGSATALATGGIAPYTYNWSNGGSGTTISNLAAGSYTVTVTDTSPGTATANVVITQPTNLVLQTPTITNVLCNGGNTGSITASASGGTSPYIYNWSNGNSGANISNLVSGNYIVTVTDDNGCTKMAIYNVSQPALIVINLTSITHESCANEMDGAITITVTGGVNPIFSEWSNGSIGNTITMLAPGSYSVTVTDNNDCTKSATYTINAGGTVAVELINQTNVTCPGGSNGAISVMASGGTVPYTYMWSNGASGASITNLAAGNYLLTATDSHGCETVKVYTITQPAPFNINITQAQINLCAGDANVDLTATASGGVAPLTALWSNGVVGLNNPNLAAGTYTITITDSHACTGTAVSVVTSPSPLTVTVSTTDETAVGLANGTATAIPSGGTTAYTYLWSNGGTTSTINGLAPGTYTVTVTDMNGCTTTGTGQVDAFGCNLDVMVPADVTVCSGEMVVIPATVTGSTGVVTYVWSNGAATPAITVNSDGEYCVTVHDEVGCQDIDCITITEIVLPPLNCVVTDESAPGANDGTITCSEIPGVVTYLWSNGATTPFIQNLSPGTYCLTVTDNSGCTASNCFNVQAGNCNLVITSLVTDVVCAGDSTGSISVTVENATAPITYIWSNGAMTSTIENLVEGEYNVTITDAAGCIENRAYVIAELDPIIIVVDSISNIFDFDSGNIQISVTGGATPYSFLWTNPLGENNTEEDQSNLFVPGNYSVVVTDANGCTAQKDSILVQTEIAVKNIPAYSLLKVYPVPAKDLLKIDLDLPVKEVIVSGIDGRTVIHINQLTNNTLDVSQLEAGWYVLRIFDGQRWYMARMVK